VSGAWLEEWWPVGSLALSEAARSQSVIQWWSGQAGVGHTEVWPMQVTPGCLGRRLSRKPERARADPERPLA
jgi:hypothetical protein